MMEKLPDHLALLLETLISRNSITSWNIYQNKNKNTCVTIRFNDSDPQISPHKYRRISDRQMNRNISRAQMFQSGQTLDHDNSLCDTDIDGQANKRRKFDTSPEANRSDIIFSAHEDLKIETPLSVIESECSISESPFDSVTLLPSSLNLTTSPQKHKAVSEILGHVECESISVIQPVITHVVDTITTVETVTFDKAILYPEPIIHDKVTEVSVSLVPPLAPDSGVRSHHQPAASGVRLHNQPAASGVRLDSVPPDNEVCLPVPAEPPDMQVLSNSNTKSDSGVNCLCCNQTMTISHMCFEEIGNKNSVEIPPVTSPVPTIEQNNRVHLSRPQKVRAPRFTSSGLPNSTCETFCFLAGFDTFDKRGHSGILYYRCSECGAYMCHVCKKYSEGSLCCPNSCFQSDPYNATDLKYLVPDM